METSGESSDVFRGSSATTSSSNDSSNRHNRFTRHHENNSNFFRSPLSRFFKYTGISGTRNFNHSESSDSSIYSRFSHNNLSEEVSIRIVDGREQRRRNETRGVVLSSSAVEQVREGTSMQNEASFQPISRMESVTVLDGQGDSRRSNGVSIEDNVEASNSYQRHDINQVDRWIEQILPFFLLLLIVFIRQHLQGFLVTIWISIFMLESNEILRKQTALKGERNISVLTSVSLFFTLHVAGVYWWYRNDDLVYPLLMLPPKNITPFLQAIFIIVVNDILVRQVAMVIKCFLLMYYKNSKGRDYRKQGQMLTVVEYFSRLYRALLPAPVWYRFFLNKEYGSIFSSLITGLYLTFKLTSFAQKVKSFISSLKALSHDEIHLGTYATIEQVNAVGDLCAICQENMQAPIVLCCQHVFCEDCVSEWLERERTCPLCRAVVKPTDIKSFADGSTSLIFQLV